MTQPQQKISFLLTGSLEEQQTEELAGPIVQQNGSPNLADSRNTRLSVRRGTCVRAPDQQPIGVDLPDGHPAFGIVGNQRHRNYALYTTPDQKNRVVAEDGYEPTGTGIIRDRLGRGQQNVFVPLQLTKAGAIAGLRGVKYPLYGVTTYPTYGTASSYNPVTDEHWVVWSMEGLGLVDFDSSNMELGLYGVSYDSDGTMLTPPQPLVFPMPGTQSLVPHVAVTAHGVHGTFLWFFVEDIAGDNLLYYVQLSVSGTKAVVSPLIDAIPDAVRTTPLFAVTSDGDRYAYVALKKVDATSNGHTVKIDMSTDTVVGSASAAGADLGVQCAIAHAVVDGSERISVLFGNGVSVVYDASLAVVLPAASGPPGADVEPVYTQFLSCPDSGLVAAVYADSFNDGGGGASEGDPPSPSYTKVWLRPLDGSPMITLPRLYGAVLHDHGATWVISENEMVPLLFVCPQWGNVSTGLPGSVWEVLDPQVIGYTIGPCEVSGESTAQLTPIARFGVVRGIMSPSYIPSRFWRPAGSNLPRIGDEFYIPYRKADHDTPGRWVKLSVKPESCQVINDRDGVAIAACALPVQWDGSETVEFGGPLTAPHLNVTVSAVGGSFEMGSYGATCTYEWRDAAGLYHRSMPCPTLAFEVVADGTALLFRIAVPLTMRNGVGQEPVQAVVYITEKNGTAYYGYRVPFDLGVPYIEVMISSPPITEPIIYSRGTQGEELVPQPPPPLRDICIVGSRAWGIDAEIPTRVVYSKHRVAGIGFEFFPAGEVIVPSNAGDVVALVEQNGTLILFAERGIYQVSDGGPNNMGQGGAFGSPYKLSEVGTRDPHSVLLTPKGVMFVDNTGCFSIFSGGVTSLPGAQLRDRVVGSFLLEDADEACFVVASAYGPARGHAANHILVFNYALMRWTAWDLVSTPTLVAQSAITRDRGIFYAPATGRTYTIDSDVIHPTARMTWETDWMILGGDFQDYIVVYDVFFNAHRDSAHSIVFELLTEYDGVVATTSREWSDAELEKIQKPNGRYTVRLEPVRQDARAMKVRIWETSQGGDHRGCRPGAVTLVYSVDGLTYEEATIPGSLK